MTPLVHVSALAEAAISAAAVRALPHEMVGLLAGRRDADAITVSRFVPIAGAECRHDRFAVPAAAFAAAEAACAGAGESWLGFAHSHPNASASLSARDRAELWRGCLHFVVAAGAATPAIRAFWLEGDAARELPIGRAPAEAAR
jgi:proteasome lid subunit RPN8/RPN11